MAGYLGAGLLALSRGRSAHLQGVQQRKEQEAEQQRMAEAKQMAMLKIVEEMKQRKAQSERQASIDALGRDRFDLDKQRFEFDKTKSDDPSWQMQETANGIVQVNPKSGEVRPLSLGSAPLKPKQQKWEVYGPGSGGGAEGGIGTWSVQQTDDGLIQVNNKTGETRPVMAPGGGVAQKPLDASTKLKIAANKAQTNTITQALGALVNNRQAVGLSRGRGISDAIDQRADMKGVETRALIANVSSLVIHDRSGANVTVGEAPRLKPFIPSIRDEPEAIVKKLRRLRELIEEETQGLYSLGGGGIQVAPTSDRAESLKAKYSIK